MDGDRGGDRLHHRPPGQRGDARHAPRPRRHGDRRLRRPRVDPRRLPALAREAARVPPQPARQAREGAGPGGQRRRRRAGGGRRRVLDGGRRPAAARDRRAVRGARGAADGRRGARRRRARRARGRGVGAVRGRGPRRPADGDVLQVAGLLRRLHRRLARGRRLPAHPVARVPVHRRGGAGRRRGRARRAAGRALGGRPAAVRPGARQRALPRGRPARARLPRDPHADDDADHPGAGRGRLEGRAAVARALRRGRVRQRRAAPRGAAGRRAAAHERDGHARPRDARPRARRVRRGQAGLRGRARAAARAA